MSRWNLTVEERFWAKVAKTETCWNWTASQFGGGYGQFSLGSRDRYAHRVSYEMVNGPIPAGMFIDHVCHNRQCVRPSHLRMVTNKQNLENRAGAQCNSRSGVRGVSWAKVSRKWLANVHHNGRTIYLGLFLTLAEAEAVVIAKRNELFTHNDADRAATRKVTTK